MPQQQRSQCSRNSRANQEHTPFPPPLPLSFSIRPQTYRTEIRRFARPSDKLRPEEEVFICEIDQTGFTVMVGYAIERRVDFDERQATNAGILDALADAFEVSGFVCLLFVCLVKEGGG